MIRRDFLLTLAALTGGALSAPLAAAVESGLRGQPIPNGSSGKALSARQATFVDCLSDLIIPRTATPGAADVGVVGFVDRMLAEYESPQDRVKFLSALDSLMNEAREHLGEELALAPRATAFAFVQTQDAEAYRHGAPQDSAYRHLKRYIVIGYYTSEDGATRELTYLPVPGGFQPVIPCTANTRNYAT